MTTVVQKTWVVPQDHPVFVGHFPEHPVVPGALLLQVAIAMWQEQNADPAGSWQVQSAKFLQACGPGTVLDFALQARNTRTVDGSIRAGDAVVAQVVLQWESAVHG